MATRARPDWALVMSTTISSVLPLTTSGKLDRATLASALAARETVTGD